MLLRFALCWIVVLAGWGAEAGYAELVRWDHSDFTVIASGKTETRRWVDVCSLDAWGFAREACEKQPGTADDAICRAVQLMHMVGHGDLARLELDALLDRRPDLGARERLNWDFTSTSPEVRRRTARVRLNAAERIQGPGWSLSRKKVARVTAEFASHEVVTGTTVLQWGVYAPELPATTNQDEIHTSLKLNVVGPRRGAFVEESVLKRRMLFLEGVGADGTNAVDGSVTCDAALFDSSLTRGNARGAAAVMLIRSQAEREREARSRFLSDFSAVKPAARKMQVWMADRHYFPEPGEIEVDFARRVLRQISRDFTYDRSPVTPAFEDTEVIARGGGQCTGLAALYVSILRGADIPARLVMGRNASSSEEGAKFPDGSGNFQEHARAEFYARGIGWIPVEVTDAVEAEDSETNEDPAIFVGNVKGTFLAFHFDMGFKFQRDICGKCNADTIRGPYFGFRGPLGGVGKADGRWTVSRTTVP